MVRRRENWDRKLRRLVHTREGRTLRTIADARAYALSLSFPQQTTAVWQYAAQLMLAAAEGADTKALCDQLEHAIRMDGNLKD